MLPRRVWHMIFTHFNGTAHCCYIEETHKLYNQYGWRSFSQDWINKEQVIPYLIGKIRDVSFQWADKSIKNPLCTNSRTWIQATMAKSYKNLNWRSVPEHVFVPKKESKPRFTTSMTLARRYDQESQKSKLKSSSRASSCAKESQWTLQVVETGTERNHKTTKLPVRWTVKEWRKRPPQLRLWTA